jgi:EAL domain-containing protein (putative c-di-GMP-specific phosphodiesterase class I)
MSTVEALLRWTSPGAGRAGPGGVHPIAEESGHIIVIGEWVLRQACAQWMRWQAQDAAAAPAGVSVNLSRVQMALGSHLVTVVNDALEGSGMPPEALQLEITERELMKDPAAARELLLALASLGARLALDDFGTGTSSLACLREHPFHSVKIDRSYVTGLSHDRHVLAVAHATVNVIENLGMVSATRCWARARPDSGLQRRRQRLGQEVVDPPHQRVAADLAVHRQPARQRRDLQHRQQRHHARPVRQVVRATKPMPAPRPAAGRRRPGRRCAARNARA